MLKFIIEATPEEHEHSLAQKDGGFVCVNKDELGYGGHPCNKFWTVDDIRNLKPHDPKWVDLINRAFGPPTN